MGDRAWVGITIYAVADEDKADLFDWMLEQAFLTNHTEVVTLGLQYEFEEMSLGWCSEEVADLISRAPSVVLEASQGNRYEFNGEQIYHTPKLGTFLADADGGGAVILNEDIVDRTFNQMPAGATALEFYNALLGRLGAPWRNALVDYQDRFRKTPEESWEEWEARLPKVEHPDREEYA